MAYRLTNTTLYSGAGKFDLSNILIRHAVTCVRIKGFLVYAEYNNHTVWKSGAFKAYQVSHRSGVLLRGAPFLRFVYPVLISLITELSYVKHIVLEWDKDILGRFRFL